MFPSTLHDEHDGETVLRCAHREVYGRVHREDTYLGDTGRHIHLGIQGGIYT